jgi:rifampicin phosphotransferase
MTQILIDLTSHAPIAAHQVGGKAYNLHRLAGLGLPVPAAVVVPAFVRNNPEHRAQLADHILAHDIVATSDTFAVRSSGVGEDGERHSFAGIFESYLNIPKNELYQAVLRVWDSLSSARSAMYATERAIVISDMAVVVQHMVMAKYAGVAFSLSPIEADSRIALIEVVEGNCDSLVSGKKTPTTLRVNKLTGMFRVSRNGEDNLAEVVLEDVVQKIMPLIEKIEIAYGMPVDVEWAIAGDQTYILQARPITA